MLSSILAIVFVLRLSRNSDRYAPKSQILFTTLNKDYLMSMEEYVTSGIIHF